MSIETGNREFERYLEYQEAMRPGRARILGGSATMLVLSTIDLGINTVGEAPHERRDHHADDESSYEAPVTPLRLARSRRLADFAAHAAELGYADHAA